MDKHVKELQIFWKVKNILLGLQNNSIGNSAESFSLHYFYNEEYYGGLYEGYHSRRWIRHTFVSINKGNIEAVIANL